MRRGTYILRWPGLHYVTTVAVPRLMELLYVIQRKDGWGLNRRPEHFFRSVLFQARLAFV